MILARHSERARPFNTVNAPWRFTATGTPCAVVLGAYDERGGEDVFSFRVVALKAVEIIEECGHGEGKIGFGGIGAVGQKNLFWVKVDSGLRIRGGNLRTVG